MAAMGTGERRISVARLTPVTTTSVSSAAAVARVSGTSSGLARGQGLRLLVGAA